MAQGIDLSKQIQQIASDVRDLSTNPAVLLQHPAFRQVHERPEDYLPAAILIYSDPKTPDLNKEITGYAMQRLPLEGLLRLTGAVADLVEQNRIPARLVEKLAFPSLDWNTRLREEYERPDVRVLLERLARMPQLSPQRRKYIEERIFSGRARQEIFELREAGQLR